MMILKGLPETQNKLAYEINFKYMLIFKIKRLENTFHKSNFRFCFNGIIWLHISIAVHSFNWNTEIDSRINL